jgi:aryl-alcohol dehydrogenase-like predicted oxidoreductase
MYTRHVGPAGLVSSAIGLGSTAFTGAYGPAARSESVRVIRMALQMGVTLLDTAGFHTNGGTELLIGEALAGLRDSAIIAAQCGRRFLPSGQPAGVDGRPAHLAMACEASLRRLGTDWIDLFYLSGVDPHVHIEESVGGLAELVTAGKVRHIGLESPSAEDLRRAHAVHPITAVVAEYSLQERSIEDLPVGTALVDLGVGLVACQPLSRGQLTGRPASARPELRALQAEAANRDTSAARLALAWLLSRRPDVIPVPSTRSRIHLEMNAAATGLRLTPAECDHLVQIFRR